MSKFLFGHKLIDYTATASSENVLYPASNLKIYNHLKRHYRSVGTGETNIVFDFFSTQTINLIFVNDINFTSIRIQGNNTNVWTSPSYNQLFTVVLDERVNRYKIAILPESFSYRYMRIVIPTQSTTDGLWAFRIGKVLACGDVIMYSDNPSYPYRYSAEYPEPLRVQFLSGGTEVVERGDYKKWSGEFAFETALKTQEVNLWSVEALKPSEHLVFYENRGDTSKAYHCRKSGRFEIEEQAGGVVIKTSVILIEEVI